MKQFLLTSVAAIGLMTMPVLANAQGMKEGGKAEAPAKADTMTKEVPAPQENTGPKAMRGDEKGAPRAEMKPGAAPKADMSDKREKSADDKSAGEKPAAKADMKPDGKTPASAAENDKTKPDAAKNARTNQPNQGDASKGSAMKDSPNGAKSAATAPPAEKRTQITSAFKQEKVTEVKNVNFNISIGTRVPATVHYYPVPRRIVEIYPEWEGYEFIFVRGEYIILSPDTHEIVYIIEV